MVITTKTVTQSRTLRFAAALLFFSVLVESLSVQVPTGIAGAVVAAVVAYLRFVTAGPLTAGRTERLDFGPATALAELMSNPRATVDEHALAVLIAHDAIRSVAGGGYHLTQTGEALLTLMTPPPGAAR